MKIYEFHEKLTQLVYECLVPILILVSMAVVGSILDIFLGGEGWFKYIFAGVGGGSYLIVYYAKKVKKHILKNIKNKDGTDNNFTGIFLKVATITILISVIIWGYNHIFDRQE